MKCKRYHWELSVRCSFKVKTAIKKNMHEKYMFKEGENFGNKFQENVKNDEYLNVAWKLKEYFRNRSL